MTPANKLLGKKYHVQDILQSINCVKITLPEREIEIAHLGQCLSSSIV